MKRILLFSVTLCSFLLILMGCNSPSQKKKITLASLPCDNAISICELKKAHFEQQLAAIKKEYKDDVCYDTELYKKLVDLYESQLSDIPCFLEGGPGKDNTLTSDCCNDDDDDCGPEDCKVVQRLFDCVITPTALDNLVISLENKTRVEIDTKDYTKLDNGFLVYKLKYETNGQDERINIKFREKGNDQTYSINFIYRNK